MKGAFYYESFALLRWRSVQQHPDEEDEDLADAHGEDLEIQAMGTGEAVETWQNGYECVLLAPQVSYRLKQLQEEIKLPIAEVPSLDYAIGNAENVMKLAHKLCDK